MKKVGLVLSSTLALACAVAVPVALGSTATGPTVKVEIKTLTKTLLRPTAERGEKGWITKDGTPRRKCSGDSAAGALDAATHGRWTATYDTSLSDVFIDSIDGVKPPNKKYYWEILVNGKASSFGACETKLRTGKLLEFKVTKG